jgi:hypothetical protein
MQHAGDASDASDAGDHSAPECAGHGQQHFSWSLKKCSAQMKNEL